MKYKNYTIILILVYLWILVADPQQRFPIIGDLRVEKILIILSWVSLFLTGKFNFKFNALSFLVVFFFFWLLLSYSLSSYQDYPLAQHWIDNYWKFIVLYFLILFAINDLKDIYVLLTGFVVIIFLYQAHSWFDFLMGGSYVYQQGIKRIIGVWSFGIGAANYYGMITMISLPFAYFWFKTADKKVTKRLLILYFLMTFASVVYSGTRGALISVLFFIFLNMRSFKQIAILGIVLVSVVLITYYALPDYLQYRYFSLLVEKDYHVDISEDSEEIAKGSAEGRLQGLVDGWKVALQHPLIGVGPGASAIARKHVNAKLLYNSESDFQLHNLYGQIFSESGFVGTLIFLSIIIVFFVQLRYIKYLCDKKTEYYHYKVALQNFMLIMLFYGMASHTLYRYYWFVLFAAHGAFISIVSNLKSQETENQAK